MYQDIIELLNQKRLKEAIVQLHALISSAQAWELQTQLENLQTTYHYMLQYAAQGTEDPERRVLYGSLLCEAYEITEHAEFERKIQQGGGYFYSKAKALRKIPIRSFSQLQQELEKYHMTETDAASNNSIKSGQEDKQLEYNHSKDIDELFDKVWTSGLWQDKEYREALALAESRLIRTNDQAVLIGAITLNLLQLPDINKLQLLLKIYQSRSENILALRAITGIALCLYQWGNRFDLYPEFKHTISSFGRYDKWQKDLENLQLALLQTRETEKIEKKMRDEILPHLLHSTPFLKEEFSPEELEIIKEKNPDWEIDMDNLKDSLSKLRSLHDEGADTMMSTFVHLKSHPFFKHPAHWLYLFDPKQPDIAPLYSNQSQKLAQSMLKADHFCNSDKYSFALMMMQIPEQQRLIISQQMSGLTDDLSDEMMENFIVDDETLQLRHYVQDLYRFFKLWHYRNEQTDIFAGKLDFWNTPLLKNAFDSPEIRKVIADYLFQKEYLDEAEKIYASISSTEEVSAETWQKLGYIYQMKSQYDRALTAYSKADLMKPDHLWTLKHLAHCHRLMQQYQKAIDLYRRIAEMEPNDLNIIRQIGQCYALMGEYEQALPYFFKLDFYEKNPTSTRRAIGWCYFMTGKYDSALQYYTKLMQSQNIQTSDWLNMGHLYLALKNVPTALEHYRKAADACSTHDEFLKLFISDRQELIKQGICDDYLFLIPEMI